MTFRLLIFFNTDILCRENEGRMEREGKKTLEMTNNNEKVLKKNMFEFELFTHILIRRNQCLVHYYSLVVHLLFKYNTKNEVDYS